MAGWKSLCINFDVFIEACKLGTGTCILLQLFFISRDKNGMGHKTRPGH